MAISAILNVFLSSIAYAYWTYSIPGVPLLRIYFGMYLVVRVLAAVANNFLTQYGRGQWMAERLVWGETCAQYVFTGVAVLQIAGGVAGW